MNIKSIVTTVAALGITLGGSVLAQSPQNFCKVEPVRSDALDNPSKHAWNLFIKLNHPAIDEGIAKGVPDCSLPVGHPGTTSVWETWRNGVTGTEVYLADGSEPPEWNDNSLHDELPGSIPLPSGVSAATLAGASEEVRRFIFSFHDFGSQMIRPEFDPDGVFVGSGGFGETRMNRPTYDFIKRNCLWSIEGQQRYAAAISSGKKPPISFPPDSIEVKAAWLDFEAEGISAADQGKYYTAEYEGKKYGLTSFHILTKDIPNWFWATFHHVDAPDNEFEVPDTYGRPRELDGTVWENYVLGGAQIDFVEPTGKPTILSDHYVEFGFQRSSCITCHATATIAENGSTGPSQPMALCILSPEILGTDAASGLLNCRNFVGADLFTNAGGQDRLIMEHGAPLSRWFENNDGDQVHFQTDFLWSLPFRARSEQSAPPARCEW